VKVPLVRGAVAEERHRHLALPLRRYPRPCGGGDAAADDPEAAHEAVRKVDHVHRAGTAAAHACRPAQHLGGERLGVRALRERVPMPAVGAGHVVVRLERRADAHRHGLLAGGQVRRTMHLALQEQPLDLLLEAPDEAHTAVPIEVLGGRLAGLVLPLVSALSLCSGHRSPLYALGRDLDAAGLL
jgi:hypothetical protein